MVPATLILYDFGGDMAVYSIMLKSTRSISDYIGQRGKALPFDFSHLIQMILM